MPTDALRINRLRARCLERKHLAWRDVSIPLAAALNRTTDAASWQERRGLCVKWILEEARRRPEAYRDLVVRIGGYTDYFTRLAPGMQDEVIRRTAYGL